MELLVLEDSRYLALCFKLCFECILYRSQGEDKSNFEAFSGTYIDCMCALDRECEEMWQRTDQVFLTQFCLD